MFKINRKVEYALVALKHMDSKAEGELCSVKEICETYLAPFDVTSRSMQKMSSAGILHSEKGSQGGYSLKKSLCNVSILEIMEVVVGELLLADCLAEKKESKCSIVETCNIFTPIKTLNNSLRQHLASITIADLICGDDPNCEKAECSGCP